MALVEVWGLSLMSDLRRLVSSIKLDTVISSDVCATARKQIENLSTVLSLFLTRTN